MIKIEHIGELAKLISKKPEFIVINKGAYKVIDYVYQSGTTFDGDPRLLECRGIKFDREGKILARPLRKFFNYGERGTELPIDKPHIILEKLDGSMIHPAIVDGELVLMTRKGVTDVAQQAADKFLRQPRYADFMHDCVMSGETPTFEYTGPENRIVLRYDEPALTLLTIRENISGVHTFYDTLVAVAEAYNIPYVVSPDMIEVIGDLDVFLEHTRGLTDAEGYVVQFEDGHMVKIKAEDYVMKHRAISGLSSKKRVLAVVLQGCADDVIALLDEHDGKDMITFRDNVNTEIEAMTQLVRDKIFHCGHMERKAFAVEIVAKVQPPALRSAVFRHLDGTDARAVVIDIASKHPEIIQTKWRGE